MPVSSVGPLVIRGAVSAGLRVLSNACTASNSAASMIAGTVISTTSESGLRSRVFQNCALNRWATNVGGAGEHLVDCADAPAPAVPCANAGGVEVLGDRLDAHRTRAAVALARQAEDQPHGLGLDGIDLQGLLRAVAVLLRGLDDAIPNRRQRAVPEALAGVL